MTLCMSRVADLAVCDVRRKFYITSAQITSSTLPAGQPLGQLIVGHNDAVAIWLICGCMFCGKQNHTFLSLRNLING